MLAPPTADAPAGTPLALIEAGMHLFGRLGFEGTSTRAIAARAGTNVASIAYHFGGKDGLRRACAAEFARRIRKELAQALPAPPRDPAAARQALQTVARTMVAFVTGAPQAGDMAGFVLRELGEDGPGVEVIYRDLIDPAHRLLCALWGAAAGQDPESEEVRLSVFAFMGQVTYFRIGRPVILRRMGWDGIDPAAAGRIADLICRNLEDLLPAGERP
jgi:TetR/AcrR family transcriptional regulator, regulator of cefoperazone and chloramphenicol sensitivity